MSAVISSKILLDPIDVMTYKITQSGTSKALDHRIEASTCQGLPATVHATSAQNNTRLRVGLEPSCAEQGSSRSLMQEPVGATARPLVQEPSCSSEQQMPDQYGELESLASAPPSNDPPYQETNPEISWAMSQYLSELPMDGGSAYSRIYQRLYVLDCKSNVIEEED